MSGKGKGAPLSISPGYIVDERPDVEDLLSVLPPHPPTCMDPWMNLRYPWSICARISHGCPIYGKLHLLSSTKLANEDTGVPLLPDLQARGQVQFRLPRLESASISSAGHTEPLRQTQVLQYHVIIKRNVTKAVLIVTALNT